DDLLPKAHKAGVKVIGWTYDSLKNPANDAKVDIAVAKYRTPSGDQVDGMSPDIEETANVTSASVTTYASALRAALGPSYPLILCTYPPDWRPNFPWQTFGQYFDVVAPMDYWHYRAKTYTYDEAFTEVSNSIKQIRNLTGKPNLPITIIGQGYDMFTDDKGSNSPTVDEIRGSMDAAKQGGAVGYSLYRWGTVNTAEWGIFGTYNW
ncbi:MAG: copper amine oxidase, partial [Tumebacillaceae bacterium]